MGSAEFYRRTATEVESIDPVAARLLKDAAKAVE